MTIHFGTDGWRAVICDTFTFHNLRQVTQAIADAVASITGITAWSLERAPDPKTMVVGFDTRFLSDRYAAGCRPRAGCQRFYRLSGQADAPTPAISYAVQQSACHGRGHDHRFT